MHHAQVEGLDTPIRVLRELIDAVERSFDQRVTREELTALLERASVAVTEFDASIAEAERQVQHERGKGTGTG